MGFPSLKVLLCIGLWVTLLSTSQAANSASAAADAAENLTETDEAEFRQGGIAQQLMSNYPVMGGLYGNTAGYQYMTNTGAGNTGGGYVNMLRNLYRPSSFGLTDKVRHWVKSFMNRRQYVKPYYNPTMGGLQYTPDEFGSKPMLLGGSGYKAISVPLRQLQKYYKPYYSSADGSNSQYLQSPPRGVPAAAAANSFLSYSPSNAASGGLYASESSSTGHFTGSNSGLFGSASDGSSSLFGSSAGSPGGIFSSANSPSSGIFSSAGGPSSGLFSSGAASSPIFASSDGSSSGLFSSPGFASGGIYGSSGSPSSGLYHGSSGSASGNVYSLDGSNGGLYGSESANTFFSASNGGTGFGSSAAASSILSSLNGANSGSYGDLYASGASPAATIYNPNSGDQGRGYGGSTNKKSPYGSSSGSSSALYMSTGERNSDSYPSKSGQETVNSFNVDSSRNAQPETSYSVSFQPAQSKSYSASYENSGFQPVSFGSEDGYKSANAGILPEKSS